jgi:hypothetical protein
MIMRKALPRRTFLKGMGTAIALPFLDAMTPALASRASSTSCRASCSRSSGTSKTSSFSVT